MSIIAFLDLKERLKCRRRSKNYFFWLRNTEDKELYILRFRNESLRNFDNFEKKKFPTEVPQRPWIGVLGLIFLSALVKGFKNILAYFQPWSYFTFWENAVNEHNRKIITSAKAELKIVFYKKKEEIKHLPRHLV